MGNLIKGEYSLCSDCVVDGCRSMNDHMMSCDGHLTAKEKARNIQHIKDLKFQVDTPSGARILKDKINKHVFEPEFFTGNSETYYKIGERSIVMKELRILLEVLDLDDYTDLVTYFNNVILKENNNE